MLVVMLTENLRISPPPLERIPFFLPFLSQPPRLLSTTFPSFFVLLSSTAFQSDFFLSVFFLFEKVNEVK